MRTNKFINITILSVFILIVSGKIIGYTIAFEKQEDYNIYEGKLNMLRNYSLDTREILPNESSNVKSKAQRLNEGETILNVETLTDTFGKRTFLNNSFIPAKFSVDKQEYVLNPGEKIEIDITKDSSISVIEGSIVMEDVEKENDETR